MATKTQPTDVDVIGFLDAVPDTRRRSEGHAIRALMERVTGQKPVMWGPTMVGFGSVHYQGKSSSGQTFVIGFSPRRGALTIYGVYDDDGPGEPLFEELGPHDTGKGCLYLKRLVAVDLRVLETLIRRGWERRR